MFEFVDFTTGLMIMAPTIFWFVLSIMCVTITLCVIKIMIDVNQISKHITRRF